MVKLKEPNPLNFFKCRELEVCPQHFDSIVLPFRYNMEEAIRKWIFNHTKGRFYVGKSLALLDDNSSVEQVVKIGFEDPKESSYFMLACPHLKYK